MFEKIPRAVKHNALALSRQPGMTQREAAELCGISERTLRRARAREIKHGDIERGQKKRGPRSIWVPSFRDVRSYLNPSVLILCRRSLQWFFQFRGLLLKSIPTRFTRILVFELPNQNCANFSNENVLAAKRYCSNCSVH
jgi:transposase-like protein